MYFRSGAFYDWIESSSSAIDEKYEHTRTNWRQTPLRLEQSRS